MSMVQQYIYKTRHLSMHAQVVNVEFCLHMIPNAIQWILQHTHSLLKLTFPCTVIAKVLLVQSSHHFGSILRCICNYLKATTLQAFTWTSVTQGKELSGNTILCWMLYTNSRSASHFHRQHIHLISMTTSTIQTSLTSWYIISHF